MVLEKYNLTETSKIYNAFFPCGSLERRRRIQPEQFFLPNQKFSFTQSEILSL